MDVKDRQTWRATQRLVTVINTMNNVQLSPSKNQTLLRWWNTRLLLDLLLDARDLRIRAVRTLHDRVEA